MNDLESRARHLEGIVQQQAETTTRLQAIIDELQVQLQAQGVDSRRSSVDSSITTPELTASPHSPVIVDPLDIPTSAIPLFGSLDPSPITSTALGLKITEPSIDVPGAAATLAGFAWPGKSSSADLGMTPMHSLWA